MWQDRVKHNSSDTNKVFVVTGNKEYSMVDSEVRISQISQNSC